MLYLDAGLVAVRRLLLALQANAGLRAQKGSNLMHKAKPVNPNDLKQRGRPCTYKEINYFAKNTRYISDLHLPNI